MEKKEIIKELEELARNYEMTSKGILQRIEQLIAKLNDTEGERKQTEIRFPPAFEREKEKRMAETFENLDWKKLSEDVEWAFITDKNGNVKAELEDYKPLLEGLEKERKWLKIGEYEYTAGRGKDGQLKFLRRRKAKERTTEQ